MLFHSDNRILTVDSKWAAVKPH